MQCFLQGHPATPAIRSIGPNFPVPTSGAGGSKSAVGRAELFVPITNAAAPATAQPVEQPCKFNKEGTVRLRVTRRARPAGRGSTLPSATETGLRKLHRTAVSSIPSRRIFTSALVARTRIASDSGIRGRRRGASPASPVLALLRRVGSEFACISSNLVGTYQLLTTR
jgi:hypothetical protein